MYKKFSAILLSAALCGGISADTIKVACVGDSITFGDGVENREQNNYPKQLGEMLGGNFEVENFGVCGAALAKNSAGPYWNEGAYKASLGFAPNIVVIMLGTNDSNKRFNWPASKSVFEGDLADFIKSYKALPSKPTVYLCLPPKTFGNPNADEVALAKIRQMIAKTASANDVKIIDVYAALENKRELFPDNLHPNAVGAKIIAETVFNFLKDNQ